LIEKMAPLFVEKLLRFQEQTRCILVKDTVHQSMAPMLRRFVDAAAERFD
jgi:hypothetical protein